MLVQVIEPLLTSLIILKFKFWLVHVLLISILGGLSLNRVLFDWLVRLARISELRSAFVIEVEDLTIVLTSFSTEFVDFASAIALLWRWMMVVAISFHTMKIISWSDVGRRRLLRSRWLKLSRSLTWLSVVHHTI